MIDWTPVIDWLLQHGTRILIILALCVTVYFVLKKIIPGTIGRTLSKTMEGQPEVEINKRKATLTRLFMGMIDVVIIVMSVFLVLTELGINIAALIAGFGIAGIAIGFGAQSLIKDLIAGFLIMIENQYNVGDVIKVAGASGVVEAVNLRRTLLRDLDGTLHIVPNGEIKVTGNFTKIWSRAHLNISVAYKEDLDQVMSIIRKTWEELAEDPDWAPSLISKTPWLLRVNAFEDSGIIIKVVGETQPIKQWAVMGEFRRRIKKVFDEQGIEIPWPHTKVYFGNSPEESATGQ
jgi:small conductance mechanosensitive channel